MRDDIVIIGGGLAGSEAAWQAANRGAKVTLYEMRPKEMTQAHKTGGLAELVCSNSLGSADLLNAPGILKEEMRRLNSLIIRVADEVRVPAGSALAVDREQFSLKITQALEGHPNIRILHEEITEIPTDCLCIVATGPLTSDKLSQAIAQLTHTKHLYFYDAISPIVDADSINMDVAFLASRYGKGGDDYLNCPMDEPTYNAFYDALLAAEKVQPKEFEKTAYFEGCIPIEVMAERGRQTMQFGPLKPVGLENPKTGARAYAVVQLRTENAHRSCYNLVGFQTKLTYGEQKRVFRMIPGLEQAEFLALRQSASQHLHQFSSTVARYPSVQGARHPLLCRAAGRCRGLYGFRRDGRAGRNQCGSWSCRIAVGHAAAHHGAWLSCVVHYDHGPASLSTDEYEFRALSSTCHTDERQGA